MDPIVLIDQLGDLVTNAKAVPLTTQIRLERADAVRLLDELRSAVPQEVERARAQAAAAAVPVKRPEPRLVAAGDPDRGQRMALDVLVAAYPQALDVEEIRGRLTGAGNIDHVLTRLVADGVATRVGSALSASRTAMRAIRLTLPPT
jgi:hypothetical protein